MKKQQTKRKPLTPMEQLRREKEQLRRECLLQERVLAEHWEYLSDNIGTLLINSASDSILSRFGMGSKKTVNEDGEKVSVVSIPQRIFSGLLVSFPLLWEVLQPLLLKMATERVKSMFTRKKKYEDDAPAPQKEKVKKKSFWKR